MYAPTDSDEKFEFRAIDYIRREILPTVFCSACGCGMILNAYVRALDEIEIDRTKVVSVSGIGCSSWIPSPYTRSDTLHTTHGRPIAFATGVKIMKPELTVVVIAGDGDIAGIGGNHLIHAARRNIDLSVFLVNNMIYGMTGGQVAPTTPEGIVTSTTPYGNLEPPFKIAELVVAAGATYVARWTTLDIRYLTDSMKEALTKKGFAFIEIISQCPEYYGRRVGMRKGLEFLNKFREQTIHIDKAESMSKAQLKDKIVVGVLNDSEYPEFCERLNELNAKLIEE
jgi:2-oxoglutarate ferredoxin oxidoreductase subunit beta